MKKCVSIGKGSAKLPQPPFVGPALQPSAELLAAARAVNKMIPTPHPTDPWLEDIFAVLTASYVIILGTEGHCVVPGPGGHVILAESRGADPPHSMSRASVEFHRSKKTKATDVEVQRNCDICCLILDQS